jgi:hypothetical protein
VDHGDHVTWRVVDGYAAGSAHVEANVPCQDRCETAVLGNGRVLVAVLADGAGSAEHAERGASLACATMVRAIVEDAVRGGDPWRIDDDAVRAWFAHVRERIVAEAAADACDAREFAATLLVCVAGDDGTLCAQLGDGGIVIRESGGSFVPALWPENGEYANQTFFVTDADAIERVALARFGRVDDVVVFSDGLTRLALDHAARSAFAPFFDPLTRTVRTSSRSREDLCVELASYLASDAVNARTDDDKSIVIATRLEND